jgi:hypothetical protein
MRVYGAAAMHDLLGDMVAYRNLCPADARLPAGRDLAVELGVPPGKPLRKGDDDYARVVAAILRAARALDAPHAALRRLIVVGDTHMSDLGAFASLCAVTGWRGRAFICQEEPGAAPATTREGDVVFANRWSALYDFAAALDREGFAVDEETVVVLDIDKTLLGARGRNHRLIDEARMRALRASVAETIGEAFDESVFETAYRALNQAAFHPLTEDNQDYVAYLCLMVIGGAVTLESLRDRLAAERTGGFAALVAAIGRRATWPSPRLGAFHNRIAALVAAGDPTPFKAFRRREYQETAARMACRPDGVVAEQLLNEELVLTVEVWQVAQAWRERGALLFGLSDKPDEAAIPDEAAAARGLLPLHCIRTHIAGWPAMDGGASL